MADVHHLPPVPRSVVRHMLAASVAQFGGDPPEPPEPRYTLRTWVGGYRIEDRGVVVSTIYGPNFALAAKLLRMLNEDAERAPEPPEAA